MNADELSVLRHLLRKLELRELPELIGQRVDAEGPDELLASSDLLERVGLEGVIESEASNLEQTMLAYGFIDLKYRLTRWPTELQKTGRQVVRTLLHDPTFARHAESIETQGTRLDCLRDMRAEVDSGVRQLTIMATALGLPSLDMRTRFRINTGREKAAFALFPREFEITDAYVTNAPTVSLNRHFYL